MYDQRTWITTAEAAKLLKCTQRAIVKMITAGKLSATLENKKYFIEKAEFFRVFPWTLPDQEREGKIENFDEKITTKLLEEKNNYLLDMIKEKTKQIEFLKDQLNNFSEEKSKMLDAINSHARLLEHKEKVETSSQEQKIKKSKWSKLFSKD